MESNTPAWLGWLVIGGSIFTAAGGIALTVIKYFWLDKDYREAQKQHDREVRELIKRAELELMNRCDADM